MKFWKSLILMTILVIGFSFLPKAFGLDIFLNKDDIDMEVSPQNPEPYTNATVKLVSYATDLDRANIEWIIGGKTVLMGIGKKSYTFQTSGPNSTTAVTVNITTADGQSVTNTINVRASEIDILWQALDSHTPPFYKGKALPVSESKIRIVAFPNTINVAQAGRKNIIYNWERNNKNIKEASGYGKDSFTFTNSSLVNSEKITLSASSVNDLYTARGSVEVPISRPYIIFYKKSPINGILYSEGLKNSFSMLEDEVTLVAEPYFMNKDSSDLEYTWKINNQPIDTPSKRTELTIRPTSRGGYATIELGIESITKLFQSVSNKVKIDL